MAQSPIVKATIQTATITAMSNLIAQVISAQQENKPITINPTPLIQFILFSLVSTPPNYLWQEFLESTWPGYYTPSSKDSNPKKDDPKKEGTIKGQPPKLHKTNTAIKTVLDQTIGAAANTLMFSLFMGGIKDLMEVGVMDFGGVWNRAMGEFWGIVFAGWRFWPLVSFVNFVFLESVESRNLLGGLAGLGWGVYLSLGGGR
ncbi:hypothetical protein QBC38DRAFT_105630 [Podospora fimiseda]|uniref:Uncharacterized protein n=1 Tax=Podospora fimiseda TaxID=252190 RepID=A0AAN7BU87_9PEZI|nr:hypothetical protein QBC38DRAFT_105630 [Podospora fimiseda]